ncbi:MAG: hypothetical protein QW046_05755 [Candidatus Micrarchaeaceae archaeon]
MPVNPLFFMQMYVKNFTYTVSFTESGLPSGTSWSVTFNNQTQTSTTDSITFTAPNGTYEYRVLQSGAYVPSPVSGPITVNNAPVTVYVTFTKSAIVGP